jgi:hypothetical protein
MDDRTGILNDQERHEKTDHRDQSDKRLRVRKRFGNHGLGKHGQHRARGEGKDRGGHRWGRGAQQEIPGGRRNPAQQQYPGPETEDVSAGTMRFPHTGRTRKPLRDVREKEAGNQTSADSVTAQQRQADHEGLRNTVEEGADRDRQSAAPVIRL